MTQRSFSMMASPGPRFLAAAAMSLPAVEELEREIGVPEGLPLENIYSDAIKARRSEIGMTQQELADICKMPQPSIARIESGESSPNLSTLQKICDALDLKIKIEK